MKPTRKVTAASVTPLIGAAIVLAAKALGVDVPAELAAGMAAAALLAFGGGWARREN